MAKTTDRKKQEAQFKNKLRTMIGCVTHMQVVADQAMEMAGRFMTAEEADGSDTLRVIENVSCVCEEALQVFYEELQKGTRLYERLCEDEPEVCNGFAAKAMRDL